MSIDKKKNKDAKSAHVEFTQKVKKFSESGEVLETDRNDISEMESDDLENDLETPDEISTLMKELKDAKKLNVDYLDKLRRSMAEFDNFRKRTIKEKSVMYDEGIRDTMDKLIPVLDNFELALNASKNKDDNFYKGIDMILKQLQTVMFDAGIEEIPALGSNFDPNLHNAVAHVVDDTFGENEIIEEMRKGYKYKDKVLRHSMVKVAN